MSGDGIRAALGRRAPVRHVRPPLGAALLALLLAGCGPKAQYEISGVGAKSPAAPGAPIGAGANGQATVPVHPVSSRVSAEEWDERLAEIAATGALPPDAQVGRPTRGLRWPLDHLTEWEDLRRALPKDPVGGVDWVGAIRKGVISPLPRRDPATPLEPPFTLDTLVPGVTDKGHPPLDFDVELVPASAEFFKVRFPHSSHTLWLNCSSCHPGIVAQRASMAEIFDGSYCGTCHGKVAFDPATACARCHVNLVPPTRERVAAELEAAAAHAVPPSDAVLTWGRQFYEGLCAVCHGKEGDGQGPFAAYLDPKPRDFTSGSFKFRTTPSGSLPTDLDLFRTVTMGVKGTGMPAWAALPPEDRWALVHYIKTFSEIFAEEEPEDPIELPAPPDAGPELLARGAEVYQEAKCWECHGQEGRADGPSAETLQDDWGSKILPADFSKGVFKAGGRVEDVFRTMSTGLDGSPMPSYGDVLSAEDRWALAYHVLELGGEPAGFGLKGEIPFSRYSREMLEVPPAMFPHWFHRVRFTCAACHPGTFEMRAGANPINMDALRSGEFCAKCHDGRTAWYVGFETCRRCHGGV